MSIQCLLIIDSKYIKIGFHLFLLQETSTTIMRWWSFIVVLFSGLIALYVAPHDVLTLGCHGANRRSEFIEYIEIFCILFCVCVNAFFDKMSLVLGVPGFICSVLATGYSCPEACDAITWTCHGCLQLILTCSSVVHAIFEIVWYANMENVKA